MIYEGQRFRILNNMLFNYSICSRQLMCLFNRMCICVQIGSNRGVVLHVFECDVNFRLAHLLKAKITGITGSGAELKLIECLLSTAVMLEELLLSRKCIDASSEVKLLHELLQLPRASTKARLVCMKQ